MQSNGALTGNLEGINLFFAGVLGARLVSSEDEDAHIEDSISLIALAVQKLHNDRANITAAPSICDEVNRWESGQKLWRSVAPRFLAS